MEVPLKIFYHVYGKNHYLEIIQEQIDAIVNCGLYEECEGIYVGFLGTEQSLKDAQKIFENYPKIKVESFSTNEKEYEFFTLKNLKKQCDEAKEKFYGFYIHTKGTSYTEERFKKAGKVWRDYCMQWVISEWRKNYKALNLKYMGYDIISPKVVPARVSPSGRTHGSGNMWAFNSEYIKSLRKIETLNKNDRFESEMWAFSGQPIIYLPCNLFIDYLCPQESYAEFVKNYPDMHQFVL